MKVQMILSNGVKLNNIELSGTTYITKDDITEETFAGGLSEVVIIKDGVSETFKNLKLVDVQPNEPDTYFMLAEYTSQELTIMKLQADIAYLAMMTDVEL